ncbi:MAG: Hsp20/alpha crystallin family protein, partial [Spirulina sp. SIO3F2]|nr:Hsp20/alpha crystallin family protein [Spirulina sp. SIO3F2]
SIIHWQPLSEIDTFRRQMDRLFNEVYSNSTQSPVTYKPAIELKDNEHDLVLKAQVPGINPDALDITVTRDSVTIQGNRKSEKTSESEGIHYSEFRYGQLKRVVGLPAEVQQDQVTADYTDGVLTLTLPKVVDDAQKSVKVSLNNHLSDAHPTDA